MSLASPEQKRGRRPNRPPTVPDVRESRRLVSPEQSAQIPQKHNWRVWAPALIEAEVLRANRSGGCAAGSAGGIALDAVGLECVAVVGAGLGDRKSTRLNSSHLGISYAV